MNSVSPIELLDSYSALRGRLARYIPDCCDEITLRLPTRFDGELAFYRLVNWAYVLVNEAAGTSLLYLVNLPPMRANSIYKREIGYLRTCLNHNLDRRIKRDLKIEAGAAGWFRDACGKGSPRERKHYAAACNFLADRLLEMLNGAVDVCDLLDSPIDGPALVENLVLQVTRAWAAHKFDPIVQQCVDEIGNPGLDLLEFRKRHLEIWRDVAKNAKVNEVDEAVRRKIEADLLSEIDARLPVSAREAKKRICISDQNSLVAALLLLRDARSLSGLSVPEILHRLEIPIRLGKP